MGIVPILPHYTLPRRSQVVPFLLTLFACFRIIAIKLVKPNGEHMQSNGNPHYTLNPKLYTQNLIPHTLGPEP